MINSRPINYDRVENYMQSHLFVNIIISIRVFIITLIDWFVFGKPGVAWSV
jgi:hypothetical protein